ncbi:MAG: 5'-deoxynucleotidase [Christensenellales bacterium]
MSSRFFAFLSRMKYIDRWGLMRSTIKENVAEHSLQVAWVAHALAVIENKFFGGRHDVCRIGMIGAYHETGEVITGDMPTPIKYFSPEINSAYKKVERIAEKRILSTLPKELYEDFASLVQPSEEEKRIVKYADKLTAYIKCVEETTCNNSEFSEALRSTERELRGFNSSAVDYFMDSFVEAYKLTLDGLAE